ncbi:MAG: NAD(P)-dependent oxidoreductase [Sporichthyaceae bacterium]|nr:NAD(P)-dependent oxidoreductase [Sporichthyaceae bacterium]
MTSVAVIGLGAMGGRIAARLLATGHDITVWNRTPAKAEPFLAQGARLAGTPAEATAAADAVFVMVADPAALAEVTEGPDGIAAGARAGTTVLQMATVGVGPTRRLTDALPNGVDLLDSPVLGSISEVEAGTLRIFVGGESAVLERWTPLLADLGTPMHVGPIGAGSAAKLVANSTLFGTLGVLGEALGLARSLGLPDDVAFDVLATTPVAPQAERRRQAIETGHYPVRFELALGRKDTGLVTSAAAESGADLRLAEAARSWFADADRDGLGSQDYSSVLGYIAGAAGPVESVGPAGPVGPDSSDTTA